MAKRTDQWKIDASDSPADVTQSAQTLLELNDARAAARAAKATEERLTARVKSWFQNHGFTAGTFGASREAVVTCRPTATFQATRFADDHPDLFEQFQVTEVRRVLDVKALAAAHPGLYQKYLAQQLKVNTAELDRYLSAQANLAPTRPVEGF